MKRMPGTVELPDINILIALVDPMHAHHEIASAWFAGASKSGWVTCPLTENGFARILSSPAYPGVRLTVADAVGLIRTICQNHRTAHTFWPDSVSFMDSAIYDVTRISGSRQTTDVYLVGLCQRNAGVFVTLDRRVTTSAIVSPRADLVRILGVSSP